MSRFRFLTFLAAFFLLVWGMSCQSPSSADKSSGLVNNPSTSPQGKLGMGTLRLTITDGPIDNVAKIEVMMTEIRVHRAGEQEDNGFVSVWSLAAGQLIDILKLKTDPFDFQGTVTAGTYNQIRISLLKDWGKIYFNDDPQKDFPLSVPSDEIKIPVQFEVPANGFTEIVLDISAENSLHIVQKGKKSEYLFRPVINVVSQKTSGS